MDEDELLAELQDRLENPPKLWTPERVPEGVDPMDCCDDAQVAGIVQTIDVRQSEDFGPYKAFILKTTQGRLLVNGFGAVLKNKLSDVQIGDGLAILYRGRVQPKTAGYQPYADYYVERIATKASVPSRVVTAAESGTSLNGNTGQGEDVLDSVPHPAETEA
jgi:hypothetical protein